jgi:hypothetical protein
MTPFLQFRIWFRRASAAQRASTVVAGALVIALLVWSAVPSTNPTSALAIGGPGGSVAGGTAPGSAAGASSGLAGTNGTVAAGGGTSSALGGAGGIAAAGGTGATGTAGPGATGRTGTTSARATTPARPGMCSKMGTLKVGVVVPEGAGGSLNSVIGNPPTSQEEADYAAVLDSVNKAGGVDCYDLAGDYVTADLTNPSGAQAGCLQFAQDKVFAVLGGFLPTFSDDCLLQAHLPTFDELAIPAGQVKQYYPYYFSTYPTYEVLYKNFVDAVNQMGYFSAGHHFAKLGIFYKDCMPEVNQAMLADLSAVGVAGAKVDRYDLGCSSSFASPASIQQGVLQFKTDGVTTVTVDNDLPDIQNISKIAAVENFHPVGGWIFPDDGVAAITASANFHPDPTEFNGAVTITAGQYGAIDSRLPETPATQACDKVMTSHGLPTVYQSGDQFAGSTCSLVWMLVAAIQRAGANQAGLAAALQAAKSVQMSFPNGPNDFSAPGTTTGGEFWRPITYQSSCQCWTVTNPAWSPSFP